MNKKTFIEKDVRERWYANGQPKERINYVNGKKNGLYERWYSNGQLAIRGNYKNGKWNGVRESWYKNGQQAVRGNFENGKRHGLYESWYSNGKLAIHEVYKDGQLRKNKKELKQLQTEMLPKQNSKTITKEQATAIIEQLKKTGLCNDIEFVKTEIELKEKIQKADDIREQRNLWTNSGYSERNDGTKASINAIYAEENGTFTIGEFRKRYGVSKANFELLLQLDIIKNTEWHHTGKAFKKNNFFSWADSDKAGGKIDYSDNASAEDYNNSYWKIYEDNKKYINKLAKEYAVKGWEYKEIERIPNLDSFMHDQMYDAFKLTEEEDEARKNEHYRISDLESKFGTPSYERRDMHERNDAHYNKIANERGEAAIEANRTHLTDEYNNLYAKTISANKDVETYNANTNGKEADLLKLQNIFGIKDNNIIISLAKTAKAAELQKIEVEKKEIQKAAYLERVKAIETKQEKWLDRQFKNGNATRRKRISHKPEFFVPTVTEMNGKYGWFVAQDKYNLPEYYSGIEFSSKRSFESYKKYGDEKFEIFKEANKNGIWLENIQWLRTSQDSVSGAVLPDGKIILVTDNLRIDTPFHEFAHKLFTYAKNTKETNNLYNAILKTTEEAPKEIKDYVKKHYSDLHGDEYLDEVFAWNESQKNGQKIADFLKERGISQKDEIPATTWYNKMLDELEKLWNNIKKYFIIKHDDKYANLDIFDTYKTMTSDEINKQITNLLWSGTKLPNIENFEQNTRLQIGNARKEQMRNGLMTKLSNATPESVENTIAEIEKLGEKIKKDGDSKTEKITYKWATNGTVILPEDNEKILQAIKLATIYKIDAMTFKSPMELINQFANGEVEEKPINPDAVKEFSNKVDYGNGLVVYNVQNNKQGQQAMRDVINSHLGKNVSPWCLLYADPNGQLKDDSWGYWTNYNSVPKRAAFQNSKLIAFCASNDRTNTWWDKQDSPHKGIPFIGKLNDKSKELLLSKKPELDTKGIVGAIEFDEETKKLSDKQTDFYRGNKKNGPYESWYDNGQLRIQTTYKDGKENGLHKEWDHEGKRHFCANFIDGKQDGLFESWHENGQLALRANYKNDGYDGLYETWHENGQLEQRTNFIDGVRKELYESWYSNGQLRMQTTYKDGKIDGINESWHENGQLAFRANYKNGKYDGLYETWHENGQLGSRTNYKDGKQNGLYESWYGKKQLFIRANYKDGKKDGLCETWNENGQLHVRANYKDGKKDGLFEEWNENGQLHVRENYKDDKKDGLFEEWNDNGQLHVRANYKDGKKDGLFEAWYENGQLQLRNSYIDNKREGLCESWHENGQLASREFYKYNECMCLSDTELAKLAKQKEAKPSATIIKKKDGNYGIRADGLDIITIDKETANKYFSLTSDFDKNKMLTDIVRKESINKFNENQITKTIKMY